MNVLEANKISKSDFITLNEDDLMFITNPGRMGDEDGSTFIIRRDNEFTIYRVDGWMGLQQEDDISLNDTLNQFPKWHKTFKNSHKKDNKKYKYLYMGFGNGLCVDNSIYSEFEPYLDRLVNEYLKNNDAQDSEDLKYAAIFNVWEQAFIDMVNDKGYNLKKQ